MPRKGADTDTHEITRIFSIKPISRACSRSKYTHARTHTRAHVRARCYLLAAEKRLLFDDKNSNAAGKSERDRLDALTELMRGAQRKTIVNRTVRCVYVYYCACL